MPDTRNVHSPYPRGQGLSSVPVLFSLPNVQPVIAAASMNAVGESTPESEPVARPAAPVVAPPAPATSSPVVAATAAKERFFSASVMSQLTNVTIGVLLIAVCFLAVRNYQGIPSQPKEISQSPGLIAAPVVEMPPAIQARSASLPFPSQPTTGFTSPSPSTSSMPSVAIPAASMHTASMPSSAPPSSEVLDESHETESSPANAPAIPLLLPKAPDQGKERVEFSSADVEPSDVQRGPYGSSPTSTSSNPVPANLASNSTPLGPVQPTQSRNETSSAPTAIDTDTPTLNTRDIILMRNGQRRSPSNGIIADPSLPKMESVPKIESLSRPSEGRGSATIMSGKSYPPVAPQFEPISMNPAPLGSSSVAPLTVPQESLSGIRNRYQPVGNATEQPSPRITQPASNASTPAPTKPYTPLSPLLPNPTGNGSLDGGSSNNNLP